MWGRGSGAHRESPVTSLLLTAEAPEEGREVQMVTGRGWRSGAPPPLRGRVSHLQSPRLRLLDLEPLTLLSLHPHPPKPR